MKLASGMRFFLTALLTTGLPVFAQERGAALTIECGGVFSLCGFTDQDGTFGIPQRFEVARPFSGGFAAVRDKGRWGFLDDAGNYAIEPVFDTVGDFFDNRAEVVLDGRAGIIDESGSFTVNAEFHRAIPFGRNAALVIEFDTTRPAMATVVALPLNWLSGSYHLYNVELGRVTDQPMEFRWFVEPGDDGPTNLIWASLNGNTFGLMDNVGNWVVEPAFSQVQPLHENRAIVASNVALDDRLWGAINQGGDIVIPLEHHQLGRFRNGYGLVLGPGAHTERKRGLMLPDGTIVGGRLFDDVRYPSDDFPAEVEDAGLWYYILEDGTLTRKEPDGTLIASCSDGLRITREGRAFGITNAGGLNTFEMPVDHIRFGVIEDRGVTLSSINQRELNCDRPIAVGRGEISSGSWTYVRTDGTALVGETWFSSSGWFVDGFAVVESGGHSDRADHSWGILTAEGEFSVPLGNDPIRRLSDIQMPANRQVFYMGDEAEQTIIDAWGAPVILPELVHDAHRERALRCSGGAYIVGDGEHFGIEGPSGETLVPPIHRAISCFRSGVAWAPDAELRQWCPIGIEGVFRDRPDCIDSYYPNRITHHYPEGFADEQFESNILWVQAWLHWGLGQRDEPPVWIGMGGSRYTGLPF